MTKVGDSNSTPELGEVLTEIRGCVKETCGSDRICVELKEDDGSTKEILLPSELFIDQGLTGPGEKVVYSISRVEGRIEAKVFPDDGHNEALSDTEIDRIMEGGAIE